MPIRNRFVQRERRPGPLHDFVKGRDPAALLALLLMLGIAKKAPGNASTRPQCGARALSRTETAELESAQGAVSKIWTRLEGRKLIERGKRHGRTASIMLKREDGSGEDYTRPTGRGGDTFFKLPHAFWLDGWHEKLDLPATAMLLIALSRPDGFSLPYEKQRTGTASHEILRRTGSCPM